MIDQIQTLLHTAMPMAGAALLGILYIWFRGVSKQREKNAIEEIDLSAKKISLDTHSKPIDDLLADSNKSHGANAVVKPPGSENKD